MFIRVFGYGESIGNIFEVQNFVVKWFRRHFMMTLPKFGQKGLFFNNNVFIFLYIIELLDIQVH